MPIATQLDALRVFLITTAESCRNGSYKNFPPITLGESFFQFGGCKTGCRNYWIRDLVKSAAAEADKLGLDPSPVLALLHPQPVDVLPAAVGSAIIFLDRIACRREQPQSALPAEQVKHPAVQRHRTPSGKNGSDYVAAVLAALQEYHQFQPEGYDPKRKQHVKASLGNPKPIKQKDLAAQLDIDKGRVSESFKSLFDDGSGRKPYAIYGSLIRSKKLADKLQKLIEGELAEETGAADTIDGITGDLRTEFTAYKLQDQLIDLASS